MADETVSAEDLRKENAELRAKLDQLKGLEEDLMAKRVFEKARGYLTSWITISGLLLTVSGIVGIKATYDYIHDLVTRKVDSIGEQKVGELLEKVAASKMEERVSVFIEAKKGEIDTVVAQKIQQLVVSSAPLRTLQGTTESQSVEKARVDYTADMMPIRDSGAEGSVVGFALTSALEYQIFKAKDQRVVLSARQLYYFSRLKAGTTDSDSGALIKDGIEVLTSRGAVEERVWPYKAGEYGRKPPPEVDKATVFKIADAKPLLTLEDIRRALNDTGPVVAGITMFESSMSDEVVKTGVFPIPKPKEKIIGGHAICIVGYDDQQKQFKFKNSWGTQWGDKGYGYLPYEYIRKYMADTWSFKLRTT